MFDYSKFTTRNAKYISPEIQEKIRSTRLLIAGCGIGSSVAEVAVRTGFEKICLADGDRVELHNLNRQNFTALDVGLPKVTGLAKRLKSIRSDLHIQEYEGWIGTENVAAMVEKADLIIDTIDFLSLRAIVALHDECLRQKKPVLSALNVGWGAALLYFPPDTSYPFRRLFGLPEGEIGEDLSYVKYYEPVISKLAAHLDPAVVRDIAETFGQMLNGRPCPAPQLSVGTCMVGALTVTAAVRILTGTPLRSSPEIILTDFASVCNDSGIDLSNQDS